MNHRICFLTLALAGCLFAGSDALANGGETPAPAASEIVTPFETTAERGFWSRQSRRSEEVAPAGNPELSLQSALESQGTLHYRYGGLCR